tara:strand:- start:3340 stop:4299 length:960 start_codon:yes stop_codon:yes gene_type:complete
MADLLTERILPQRNLKPDLDSLEFHPSAQRHFPEDRIGRTDRPVTTASYSDTVKPFYENYPGGWEGARSEAIAHRNEIGRRFDQKTDVALSPMLEDARTMNRHNPVYLGNKQPERYNGRWAGHAMGAPAMKDKNGTFGVIEMFPKGVDRYSTDESRHVDLVDTLKRHQERGFLPRDAFTEEIIHTAQPNKGVEKKDLREVFGRPDGNMPYGAINAELGAKLTKIKQGDIQKKWDPSMGEYQRKDSWNMDDSKRILDDVINDRNLRDGGLRSLIKDPKGLEYIKNNKPELLQFLMSTAQVDSKPQPGMFTGQNPMVESYA